MPDRATFPDELLGVSLFASSGIGDLALRALGVKMLVANELLPDRASLFQANYPETLMIPGDIREISEKLLLATQKSLGGRRLDLLFATRPCQGMSKNGRGKLLRGVRDGLRSQIDPRNQLAT
jgi:DNA (cytosine-5)-methyltransferase 1